MRARAALAAGVAVAALAGGRAGAGLRRRPRSTRPTRTSRTRSRPPRTPSTARRPAARRRRRTSHGPRSQLPAARAAYAAATGRLSSARDRLALIRQTAPRSCAPSRRRCRPRSSWRSVASTRSETLIARIVRYQYQTGGYAELQVVLDADSPTDFVQRVMADPARSPTRQAEVIDQLNADKAVLAAREQQMQVTEEAIEATEAEAEEQVARAARPRRSEAREAKQQDRVAGRSCARTRLRVAEQERAARGPAAQPARGGAGRPAGADRPGRLHRVRHPDR